MLASLVDFLGEFYWVFFFNYLEILLEICQENERYRMRRRQSILYLRRRIPGALALDQDYMEELTDKIIREISLQMLRSFLARFLG